MKREKTGTKVVALLIGLCLILSGCGAAGSDEQDVAVQESTVTSEDAGSETEIATGSDSDVTDSSDEEPAAEAEEVVDIIPAEGTYAYSIIVSINPQCELYYDRSDVVVGIAYLNEDAKTAYLEKEWIGLSLEESMAQLITATEEAGFMKEPTVSLELAKVGDEDAVSDSAMLDRAEQAITETLSGEETADSQSGTENTAAEAESSGKTAVIEKTVSEEVEEQCEIYVSVTCPTCGGTGIWCKTCNNTGWGPCSHCGGTGVGCENCGGSGTGPCHGCNGQGSYTCKVCGGSGTVDDQVCNGCGGSGRETCNHCGGSGRITCEYCNGTNHCKYCKGSGQAPCQTCGGTPGACETCNGTGLVVSK
ncbi:MAG: hypothetical protein K6D96_00880 [Acetatifactor sp.]|nr:hypothetical protein [Acetatifactor sp.]